MFILVENASILKDNKFLEVALKTGKISRSVYKHIKGKLFNNHCKDTLIKICEEGLKEETNNLNGLDYEEYWECWKYFWNKTISTLTLERKDPANYINCAIKYMKHFILSFVLIRLKSMKVINDNYIFTCDWVLLISLFLFVCRIILCSVQSSHQT